jgi:hypothetical protein
VTERPRRFILQAYYPEYACPAFETMFTVERLEELQALLGPDAQDDPEIEMVYPLEPADLATIAQRFGVTFDGRTRRVPLPMAKSARAALSRAYRLRTAADAGWAQEAREHVLRVSAASAS